MGSLSEEEDQFFDTSEEITSVYDSGSDCPDDSDFNHVVADSMVRRLGYEIWIEGPISIHERRNKFLKWMGLSLEQRKTEGRGDIPNNAIEVETDRLTAHSGTVLASSNFGDGFSRQSSSSCLSAGDARESCDAVLDRNFSLRIKNLDDGTEFLFDELGQDGMFCKLRQLGSNQLLTVDDFERSLGLSSLVQKAMRRDAQETKCSLEACTKQVRKGWLRRLGVPACIFHGQVDNGSIVPDETRRISGARTKMVKVHPQRKRVKEFSGLYAGQDIKAHDGSVLTMKFSPDGLYLATAGEDSIVRVWQILAAERSEEFDVNDMDPSFMYFTVNEISKIASLQVGKDSKGKSKTLKKTLHSTSVVFPEKVFKIAEIPVHEFHGHLGEVLDLSWSKNKCILSSSSDTTVRLWQVGNDQCLKVFFHKDYVTCVQFNPMDENYFVTGSIDGKVRIWEVAGCQVVDWNDIHEIVTAVCYQPDGKGLVIGSITGACHFYNASDNCLQPCGQVSFQGKKKSPSKRITGFQFSPSDPSKLMVTSADSQVRILHGVNIICKFRGLRNTGGQISASFTLDGMHVVSGSEDSNVYLWNYLCQDGAVPHAKNKWSYEHFASNNASIALPWPGVTYGNHSFLNTLESSVSPKLPPSLGSLLFGMGECPQEYLKLSSPDNFSGGNGMFSESLPKGSATWPEEKLLSSCSVLARPGMRKSQFKLLKAPCDGILGSPHAWGMVIVTGGWDGRIRSFQNFGLPYHL